MIPAAFLLTNSFFFFEINHFRCVLSSKFAKLFHAIFTDIEKPNEIYSLTVVVDKYSGLFLHESIFSNTHSRSA